VIRFMDIDPPRFGFGQNSQAAPVRDTKTSRNW
jgi:hypothetical protein